MECGELKEILIVDDVLGGLSSPIERPSVKLALDRCSVADLIRFRVEQEIAREDDALGRLIGSRLEDTETRLNPKAAQDRHFSAAKTARHHGPDSDHTARIEETLTAAQTAFDAGQFLLLLNDTQVTDLEHEVSLAEVEAITFVRLLALQGG